MKLRVLAWTATLLCGLGNAQAAIYPFAGGPPPGWVDGVDPLYTFTYSDPYGNLANGTLTAIGNHVVSGSLTVTASSDANASVGTYSLLPSGPGASISPTGLFAVDNLIYTAQPLALLDIYGLIFGQPGTGSQIEINIWGNGGGDYAFYSAPPSGGYNIQVGAGGAFALEEVATASAVAVPEPASIAVWCLLGLLFAKGFRQRKRR